MEEQSKFKAGDFLTRLTDDVNRTTEVFASFSVQQLIRFVVVFTATLVLLLVHDWRIALAGVAYGAINLALSLRLNPYAKSLEADAKTEVVRSASFLIEAVRGIPIVRVFTLGPVMGERYRRICECIREKRMKYRTVIGITYGVVDFFSQSAQAVGFLLGVLLAGDEVSLGQAVFNATLMGMMADSVYRLSTFLLLIQPNLVGMERVFHLLSQPVEATVPQRVLPAQGEAAVELRDVSFSYGEKPCSRPCKPYGAPWGAPGHCRGLRRREVHPYQSDGGFLPSPVWGTALFWRGRGEAEPRGHPGAVCLCAPGVYPL